MPVRKTVSVAVMTVDDRTPTLCWDKRKANPSLVG